MRISIHIGLFAAAIDFTVIGENQGQRYRYSHMVFHRFLRPVKPVRQLYASIPLAGQNVAYPLDFSACDSRILPRRQRWSCFWPGREAAMFPAAGDYPGTARYEAAASRRYEYCSWEHLPIRQSLGRISFFNISPIVWNI